MSKYWNGREIKQMYFGKRVISAAYKGLKLIWQIIKSCFGGGFWNNRSPWNNQDGWRNK
jgi:hypothetical protein